MIQERNPNPYQSSKPGNAYNARNHDEMGTHSALLHKPSNRFNWNPRNGKHTRMLGQGYPDTTSHMGGFQAPHTQNRLKVRRVFHPKKFRAPAPYAPRNTTSFIIRAKKAGGIASLVSPCPLTPAVLPTPVLSPAREDLIDMAKEEWGVNGYGSMKGFIRLRANNARGDDDVDDDEDDDEDDESESDIDVDQAQYSPHSVQQFERRLDQDLSRFEMIYPSVYSAYNYNHNSNYNYIEDSDGANLLETRVDDLESHILHLEEENLILKRRLLLMEQDMADLRCRLLRLEGRRNAAAAAEDEAEICSEKSTGEASCCACYD